VGRFLGAPRIVPEERLTHDAVGIATGLAWTATGGDVLFVEATVMKGKGRLTLTGHLGEVMKESAHAALSWARSHARHYGIREDYFQNHDIHIHVPEGAIPKDGPSAGITVATAMISTFTGRAVRCSLAMTGEITLRGQVLPIGGLKEKILAARRLGITELICPRQNERELREIPKPQRRGMKFHLIGSVEQVLELALVPAPPTRSATGSSKAPKPYRARIKAVNV